jgi:hypothetical protein
MTAYAPRLGSAERGAEPRHLEASLLPVTADGRRLSSLAERGDIASRGAKSWLAPPRFYAASGTAELPEADKIDASADLGAITLLSIAKRFDRLANASGTPVPAW